MAACRDEPVFAQYCGVTPVPHSSQLHGWLDDSLRRASRAATGSEYQANIEPLLPATATGFFSHYSSANPSTLSTLQRSLNAKANSHTVEAAVQHAKEQSKQGDRREWAHHKVITARGAWGWKATRPAEAQQRLSDVEYTIAARLNLGLTPFPARAMAALPEFCPLCTHRRTGLPVSIRHDPWHFLSCTQLMQGELSRRHNAVVDAVARVAWLVGAQVQREVKELDPHSAQRPDLLIVFPGRMLLTDVVVSHSLTAHRINERGSAATRKQGVKDRKYAHVASRLGAELLNVSADTCGGLASDAFRLVRAIGEEGDSCSLGTWSSAVIERQLLSAIAVAVQRGNALAVLAGYTRSCNVRADQVRRGVEILDGTQEECAVGEEEKEEL